MAMKKINVREDPGEMLFAAFLVLIGIAIDLCGLDFGIYNFKLMLNAIGIKAVAHFFIGLFSVVMFVVFTKLIIQGIKSWFTEYITNSEGEDETWIG